MYRVYERQSRKPAEHGGNRISRISVTSDDESNVRSYHKQRNVHLNQMGNVSGHDHTDADNVGGMTIKVDYDNQDFSSLQRGNKGARDSIGYRLTSSDKQVIESSSSLPVESSVDVSSKKRDSFITTSETNLAKQEFSLVRDSSPANRGSIVETELKSKRESKRESAPQRESYVYKEYKDYDDNQVSVPGISINGGEGDVGYYGNTKLKTDGSVRSLREVIASQKGNKGTPAKDRPKLALSPNDPIYDDMLSVPAPVVASTADSIEPGPTSPIPAAPPPPSYKVVRTSYKSNEKQVDTSNVIMRKKETKKVEDHRGSKQSMGASQLAAQNEEAYPIQSIHDSLRDLDIYLKGQRDPDSASVSSKGSSKLEQFHFALTTETTPM